MGLALIYLVNMSTMTSRWMKPPGAFLKGPKRYRPHMAKDHVTGDALELLGWHVDLSCIVLAPLARPHDLNRVGSGCWLVKTLPEGLSDHAP
jgi:hypothetical protein